MYKRQAVGAAANRDFKFMRKFDVAPPKIVTVVNFFCDGLCITVTIDTGRPFAGSNRTDSVSYTHLSSIPITPATHDAPVPLAPAVDMSYFDDALFIGDSRTEGFMMYSGVDNATYYAYKGLSVRTAFTKNVIRAKDGSMTTVENALKQQSFGKVLSLIHI